MILPNKKRVRLFQESFARAFDRLGNPDLEPLLPGLLIGIVVLIIGLACSTKAFEAANPRLGYPAQLVPLNTHKYATQSGVWFSMSAPGTSIIVTTDDQRLFEWPMDPKEALDADDYQNFRNYLAARRLAIIENLVLSMDKADLENKTRAIVAVDEHLTYAHFKPVMLALASAGYSRYAFETRSHGDEFEIHH